MSERDKLPVMSVVEAQHEFLEATTERLSADAGVAAVILVGSAGRGEADDWSDLDIDVVADDECSAEVLSHPYAAEQFGDLLVWVDCSFNAVIGDDGVQPLSIQRRTVAR